MVTIPGQPPRAPLRKRQPLDNMLDSVESWITERNGFAVRRRSVSTSEAPAHPAPARRESSTTSPISTALVLQILVLVALVLSITLFVIYRRRRAKKLNLLNEQRINAPFFGNISAPNGLAPPPYGEALKSPVISEVTAYNHQRQRSNSMLMDECWKAVYAAEDGTANPGYGSTNTSRPETHMPAPASPQTVAQTGSRNSVAGWLRTQRWLPGGGANPLNSNPLTAPSTPMSARMPVPPSPSYNGVTPSVAPTPTTATYLVAPGPQTPGQPLSARSWATGDDSVNDSVRSTFVPQTALYPPPLQPAPKGHGVSRSLTGNTRRTSGASWTSSVGDSYDRESGTWKTMTPHEDPPSREPRRGNPDEVSPI
ncbi:hypothetical protein KVR01_007089 [Diaporthe batatas]|uniref:uncharacterized protein n=1 Tax=Diaporthe batatas TaxID=748121 RepID=UPI001D042EB0|nr:uncharacterized protein KVR01_007089 [Diaporthe batatas]KAG8163792.1 hypothetical protein KVR01_007089 [Diaporthe batatas]